MSQTEDYSVEPVSQITLRNYYRETWLSAQFYLLLEQRTLNKSRVHFFKVKKKKENRPALTQPVSVALAPGKGALLSKEY